MSTPEDWTDVERALAWERAADFELSDWDYTRGGDCFAVAANLVLLDPTLTLCHGQPIGSGPDNGGKRYWHAWVERIDQVTIPANTARLMPHDAFDLSLSVVVDRSNGKNSTWPREVYYALGHIHPDRVRRYDRQETITMLDRFRHWGPWDEDHPAS